MASAEKILPDTMVSPETSEVLRRDVRPFVVTYKGKSRTVDLPGYYPENGDDGVHVGDDMEVTDAALRALKEEVEGIPSPTTIRRVRQKLNLSQREAYSRSMRRPSTNTNADWSSRAGRPASCYASLTVTRNWLTNCVVHP